MVTVHANGTERGSEVDRDGNQVIAASQSAAGPYSAKVDPRAN